MQTLDNAIALRPRSGPFGSFWLQTEQDPERPNPTFIPVANKAADWFAKRTGGIAQSSVMEATLNIPTTAHILGGAVIGSDPSRGVIDAGQHVFGYENLLVVDGSAVPANVGVNPSLTITALAEHAMSRIPAAGRGGRRAAAAWQAPSGPDRRTDRWRGRRAVAPAPPGPFGVRGGNALNRSSSSRAAASAAPKPNMPSDPASVWAASAPSRTAGTGGGCCASASTARAIASTRAWTSSRLRPHTASSSAESRLRPHRRAARVGIRVHVLHPSDRRGCGWAHGLDPALPLTLTTDVSARPRRTTNGCDDKSGRSQARSAGLARTRIRRHGASCWWTTHRRSARWHGSAWRWPAGRCTRSRMDGARSTRSHRSRSASRPWCWTS